VSWIKVSIPHPAAEQEYSGTSRPQQQLNLGVYVSQQIPEREPRLSADAVDDEALLANNAIAKWRASGNVH